MKVSHAVAARKRKKKVLASAKGYWGDRSRRFRRAVETVRRGLAYAYRDRRNKKREFRLQFLNDTKTTTAVTAERAFLYRLEGGCQVPIGAFAEVSADQVKLTGMVASVDGKVVLKESMTGPVAEAYDLGTRLANKLLDRGGREILAEVYNQQ